MGLGRTNVGRGTEGRFAGHVIWMLCMVKTMLKFLRKTALWVVALPLLCFFLGAALNQAVLVANHDKFPVMWNDAKVNLYRLEATKAAEDGNEQAEIALALLEHGYLDDTHCLMTKDTHLNFLADWIDMKSATYSPGDLVLELGESGLIYAPFIWATIVIGRLRKKED